MELPPLQKPKSKPRLVACRECHRSKLKCDRSYPCKSCIKRGCADICPDGTLVATKRQKSAIEASHLREKTAAMAERIHQLEEALAKAHATTSSDIHPLLTLIPNEDSQGDHSLNYDGSSLQDNDVIDAFGTLSIGSDGRSKYHNQSASADYFAEVESPDVPNAGARALRDVGYLVLPQEIMFFASLFPFGTCDRETLSCSKEDILAFLPSPETAWNISDTFFTHGCWLFDAITRAEFMDEVYSDVYSSSSVDAVSVDRLSLLFIVLALGTLLDLTKPYDIRASEPYFQLSRAAFCLEPIAEAATVPTIQSLHYMIVYLYMTDRHSAEHRWLNMGLVAKLVYSSGLHRDCGNWIHDDPQETERRRRLFWEIYAYDTWITFIMGRPPSFALPHIQCMLPFDADQIINEKGQAEPSFYTVWKYQYRSQCLVPVVEEAFGAKSPSYATILRLDRKIRDFEIPSSLKIGIPIGPADSSTMSLSLSMQRYMLFCERETSLLYLHRSFFAQAVFDCPENPLESKFATSVTATYRSACLIVAGTHDATVRHPELAARFWFFWSNLFSAAIVLGSIVTRSPGCQLSASAMNELNLACNLMEQRAASGRSAKAVPILRRLRDKARGILIQLAQRVVDKASPRSGSNVSSNDDEDELAMFAGRTRFVGSTNSRSPTASPRSVSGVCPRNRRSSENLGSNVPSRPSGRRSSDSFGSESFGFGDISQADGGIYPQQRSASLLQYVRDANTYVTPQLSGDTAPASPPRPIVKSEVQPGFAWVDQAAQHSGLLPPNGGAVYEQFSNTESAPMEHSGLYAPIPPNPGSVMAGDFQYTGELGGDGTWQQLMVQLGVMEGHS